MCTKHIYEVERVTGAMTTAKKNLLGTNMKNCYLVGEIKTVGWGSLLGRIFPGGGITIFFACECTPLQ